MWSSPKTKLSYRARSNHVWSMKKTRQGNKIIDHIGMVYAKTETELSRPINTGTICNENQTGQRRDRLCKCGLHRKRN